MNGPGQLKHSGTGLWVFQEVMSDQCSFIFTESDHPVCPMYTEEGHCKQVLVYLTLVELQVNEPWTSYLVFFSPVIMWSVSLLPLR